MSTMPKGTRRLLVRDAGAIAIGQDYVDWATEALSDGYDCPSLRVVAAADLDGPALAPEVAPRFRAALSELRIEVPQKDELLRAYVREIARDILGGAMSPRVGVGRIHDEVLSPFLHPRDLQAWCDLRDGFIRDDDRITPLKDEALDDAIRQTARQWSRDA